MPTLKHVSNFIDRITRILKNLMIENPGKSFL